MLSKAKFFLIAMVYFGCQSLIAADCVFTVAKDSCWQSYSVDVSIYDANNKLLATVQIPKDKPWSRVDFSCQEGQVLKVLASYSPVVFANETNQVQLNHYITLPQKAPDTRVKWAYNICFGADFVKLPLPPTAQGSCSCQFDKIPEVNPTE